MRRTIYIIIIMYCVIPGFLSSAYRLYGESRSYDKGKVAVRLPDKRELDRIRTDKSFQYEAEVAYNNAVSELIAGWLWLRKNIFSRIFSEDTRLFWRLLPYIIIAAALVIVIIVLRHGDFFGLFSLRKSRGIAQYDFEEDIDEIDLDSMIDKYSEAGDYRMAFRYRFLQTLKFLSVNEIIAWKKEKTNRDYVREIQEEPLRSSFEELVRIFEYVWYGNFIIDMDFFNYMNEQFQSFDSSLGRSNE